MITGITYAYLNAKEDIKVTSNINCGKINYQAEKINMSNLSSTTNYLEGAKSNIILAQDKNCPIYSIANIYLNTNEETELPLDIPALKYKVFSNEKEISGGTITTIGDTNIATVPLTINPTIYTVYLYVDPSISQGNFDNLKYSGYIYTTTSQTSTISKGQINDLSGNNNNVIYYGATLDKEKGLISIDGKDDYLKIENLDWDNTTAFTIDFVAKIYQTLDDGILFESSINSNSNYGSFYIDTAEYGVNDITLAMKYNNATTGTQINHQLSNNILDNSKFQHYTVTFNSQKNYNNFTDIYLNSKKQKMIIPEDGSSNNYKADISNKSLKNYPFFIASRSGGSYFTKMDLKELRIYNKELSQSEIMSNERENIVYDKLLAYYDFSK